MNAISCHHFGRRTARTRAGSSARLRREDAMSVTAHLRSRHAVDASQSARGGGEDSVFSRRRTRPTPRIRSRGAVMANRRVGGAALAAGALMLAALAAPSFGSGGSPGKFGKPLYVDKQLAGGEPIVFYDSRHQTYIYSAHEGTTHTLHDGLVEGVGETASFAANYRNQVNIWTSRDGRHWTPVNLAGTGFEANPAINSGFSDPDLTQDQGGRIYNTGIDLVNDALFSSGDGGRTWDKGTVQCHDGDRPWLAGGASNQVFMGTDTVEGTLSHQIFQSTDGGQSCGTTGIPDAGSTAGGGSYTGFGKLAYNSANKGLIEPVVYMD